MDERLLFQVCCLEAVKRRLALTGKETEELFRKHSVYNYLDDGYDVLHTQDQEYMVDDIIDYIKHHQAA